MNPDYEAFFRWWKKEQPKMQLIYDEDIEDYALRVAMHAWLSAIYYARDNSQLSATNY
jgi:3'-phosphoadenosine 5'-phosphosulfate sulfotransferase